MEHYYVVSLVRPKLIIYAVNYAIQHYSYIA